MKRWLMAVVLGLTVVGCAEGVEDPQPAPAPEPTQNPPPAQTFSEQVSAPIDTLAAVREDGVPALPGRQVEKPPTPGGNPGQ